jgi:hypothetical protein
MATKQCIGGYYNQNANKIVWFLYDSDGNHAIYQFDTKSEETETVCAAGAILNLDPNYPIHSNEVLSGGTAIGDVYYWVNSQKVPQQININQALGGQYGTFRASYLSVIKEPADIPVQCVYVDDATVTSNNMHKVLFQFKTRGEFNNFDKPVFSARSIVPLPIDAADPQVDADPTKNAAIALVFQTGPPNMKKIGLAAAVSQGTVFSDFFEIDSLDKSALGIPDDDIYIYYFKNDKTYISIDVPQSIQLQDKVPLEAGTQVLLNGNVPAYGDIVEGYNTVSLSSSAVTGSVETNRRTQPKVLLVVAQGGKTIGTAGDPIHVIVLGAVTEGDVFNIYTTSNTITYTAASGDTPADVITGLSANAAGQGFTIISSDDNNLYISRAAQQLIRYLLTPATVVLGANDATFVYDWWSREAYCRIYFDEYGRTNGALISSGQTVTTSGYSESSGVPQIPTVSMTITNQPPIWAKYYHIGRSKNLTKVRPLQWITDRTFKDNVASDDGYLYAYIGIESLNTYIHDKPAAKFLAYDFAAGDRIRFIKLYPTGGATTPQLYTDKEYEIQQQVLNPMINGKQYQGQFLKIYLPDTDIAFDFGIEFHSPAATDIDYSNYFIELFTPTKPATEGLDTYYEFSERYAIGNAGLSTRYHQGQRQNQSTNYATPATFLFDQGDFYMRYRTINAGVEFKFTAQEADVTELDFVPFSLEENFNAVGYSAQAVPAAHLSSTLADSENWMVNVTDGNAYTFNIRGNILVTATNSSSSAFTLTMYSTKPDGTEASQVLGTGTAPVSAGHQYDFAIDTTYTVNAGYTKLFLLFITPDNSFQAHIVSGQLTITDSARIFTQLLIDPNFSDSFQSAVNSNGRPQVFDPNARQVRNPVLMRYGLGFDVDTSVNQTNRFYFQNFDTYDSRYGPIVRFWQMERVLRVFQYRKCGAVGVYARWVKQADGSNQLITSDTIITPNNIDYYVGDFGIGNQPMGLAASGYANYFPDPVKGYLLRLSLDGVIALSDLYKAQTWAGTVLPPYMLNFPYQYGGFAKLIGAFNFPVDRPGDYMLFAQQGISEAGIYGIYNIGGEAMAFNEQRNAFTSKYDISPDFVITAENKLYAWYGGQMYIFDNVDEYNTFFGTKYDSVVEFVSKDPKDVKKTFESLSYNSPYPQYEIDHPLWLAPNIGDVSTATGQQSNMVEQDFYLQDGMWHGDFQRAYNIQYGVIEGEFLKGLWIKLRLANTAANFTWLSNLYINWLVSQKTL